MTNGPFYLSASEEMESVEFRYMSCVTRTGIADAASLRRLAIAPLLILSLLASAGHAASLEYLGAADFQVNGVVLEEPMSVALKALGPAKSSATASGFHVYDFGRMTIWAASDASPVTAFQILSPGIKTHRGLQIGDSVHTLELLYGHGESEKVLVRAEDDVDANFTDYSEVRFYEYYEKSWYTVFYLKGQKVVRIYFYVGSDDI